MLVTQTTGVELQMKCVNIPESSDSVVSAPSLTTGRLQLLIHNSKIAKSRHCGCTPGPFTTIPYWYFVICIQSMSEDKQQ